MRDWQALVRERLSGCELMCAQQDEVVAELAAHLEDLYEEQLAQGVNETGAVHSALDEVPDWRKLARKIRNSKQQEEQMSNRTRKLWLPGFASLATASVALILMNRMGIEPKLFWYGSKVGLVLFFPWLMVLPLFGGLGPLPDSPLPE